MFALIAMLRSVTNARRIFATIAALYSTALVERHHVWIALG
jgi:hypothetical protein